MAKEILIPSKPFSRGEIATQDKAVPLKTGTIYAYLPKTAWPDKTDPVLRARFLYSGDFGVKWATGEWFSFAGNPMLNRTGQLITEVSFANSVYYPPGKTPDPMHDPDNPGRMVRIEIEAIDPLTTALSFECTERSIAKEAAGNIGKVK